MSAEISGRARMLVDQFGDAAAAVVSAGERGTMEALENAMAARKATYGALVSYLVKLEAVAEAARATVVAFDSNYPSKQLIEALAALDAEGE